MKGHQSFCELSATNSPEVVAVFQGLQQRSGIVSVHSAVKYDAQRRTNSSSAETLDIRSTRLERGNCSTQRMLSVCPRFVCKNMTHTAKLLCVAGSTTPGSAGSKDSDRIRLESIASDRSENSGMARSVWNITSIVRDSDWGENLEMSRSL